MRPRQGSKKRLGVCTQAPGRFGVSARGGLCFGLLATRDELDPFSVIFLRRIVMLRRMLVKHPTILSGVQDIMDNYIQNRFPGTLADITDLHMVQPAPPFGHQDRAAWKHGIVASGPIGHLLYSAAHYGVIIDRDLNCHRHNEVHFSIQHIPYQFLRLAARQFISSVRTAHACSTRSDLQNTSDIDFSVLHKCLGSSQMEEDEMRIVRWHLTMSGWSDYKLHCIGRGGAEYVNAAMLSQTSFTCFGTALFLLKRVIAILVFNRS